MRKLEWTQVLVAGGLAISVVAVVIAIDVVVNRDPGEMSARAGRSYDRRRI